MTNRSRVPASGITVSVILATYNRAHYLPEALDSLLNQTRSPDEIIIVDDGSTDNTTEVVSAYGKKVRYFKQTENRGRSVALNYAVPLAQGSHIWIFDDDDVALADALQSHVDLLNTHPGIDFSYSANYVFSGEGNIWQSSKWKSKYIPPWSVEEFFIRHALNMHALLQGMLIPKRCFEKVGFFNPTLLRSQDNEMVLRLARCFSGCNLQKPTFVLREHAGMRGPRHQRHAIGQRAEVWLQYGQKIYRAARRNYPLSAYLLHTPGTDISITNDPDRSLALLQRGAIMLQHGLMDEALADMRAGLSLLKQAPPPSARFKSVLSQAFNVDAWRLARPYAFISEINRTLIINHLHLLRPAILRGIYWAFRRAVCQCQWRDALRSAAMLGFLSLPVAPRWISRIERTP